MINITKNFPKPFCDISIRYRGIWYWGYYLGDDYWRVGTSEDGKQDTYVDTVSIDDFDKFDNK